MKKKIFACALIIALAFISASSAEIISGPGVAVVEVEGGKIQGYIRNGIFTYLECLTLKQKFLCLLQN